MVGFGLEASCGTGGAEGGGGLGLEEEEGGATGAIGFLLAAAALSFFSC